jgi:hypothetical protein
MVAVPGAKAAPQANGRATTGAAGGAGAGGGPVRYAPATRGQVRALVGGPEATMVVLDAVLALVPEPGAEGEGRPSGGGAKAGGAGAEAEAGGAGEGGAGGGGRSKQPLAAVPSGVPEVDEVMAALEKFRCFTGQPT